MRKHFLWNDQRIKKHKLASSNAHFLDTALTNHDFIRRSISTASIKNNIISYDFRNGLPYKLNRVRRSTTISDNGGHLITKIEVTSEGTKRNLDTINHVTQRPLDIHVINKITVKIDSIAAKYLNPRQKWDLLNKLKGDLLMFAIKDRARRQKVTRKDTENSKTITTNTGEDVLLTTMVLKNVKPLLKQNIYNSKCDVMTKITGDLINKEHSVDESGRVANNTTDSIVIHSKKVKRALVIVKSLPSSKEQGNMDKDLANNTNTDNSKAGDLILINNQTFKKINQVISHVKDVNDILKKNNVNLFKSKSFTVHEGFQVKTAINIESNTRPDQHDLQVKTSIQVKKDQQGHNKTKVDDNGTGIQKDCKSDCISNSFIKISHEPIEIVNTILLDPDVHKLSTFANIYLKIKSRIAQVSNNAFKTLNLLKDSFIVFRHKIDKVGHIVKHPGHKKGVAAANKKKKSTVIDRNTDLPKTLQPPGAVIKKKKARTHVKIPRFIQKPKAASKVKGQPKKLREPNNLKLVAFSEPWNDFIGDYMRILMKDYQRYLQRILREPRSSNIDLNKMCFIKKWFGLSKTNVANTICANMYNADYRKVLDHPEKIYTMACKITKVSETPKYFWRKSDVSNSILLKLCILFLTNDNLRMLRQYTITIFTDIEKNIFEVNTLIFKKANDSCFDISILLSREFEPWFPIPWLPYYFDGPIQIRSEANIEWPVKYKLKQPDFSRIRNPVAELPLPPK